MTKRRELITALVEHANLYGESIIEYKIKDLSLYLYEYDIPNYNYFMGCLLPTKYQFMADFKGLPEDTTLTNLAITTLC